MVNKCFVRVSGDIGAVVGDGEKIGWPELCCLTLNIHVCCGCAMCGGMHVRSQ